MDNSSNPYNYQEPIIPIPPMPRQRGGATGMQRLYANHNVRPMTLLQERTLPNWVISRSVVVFFIAFAACTFAFGYPMESQYAFVASISVILFFYGCRAALNGTVWQKEKAFVRNVMLVGLLARLLWGGYCYFFFNPEYFNNTFGDSSDTGWYMPFGEAIAQWIRDGFPCPLGDLMEDWNSAIDDVGYPIWLGVLYFLTGGISDVLIPFILKSFLGAYCAISIYYIAKRHFGEGVARLAAVFVAFNPNVIYWSATMLKETEMMFLCCVCVNLVDKTFTSDSRLTFKSLLPGVLVGMYVFFFRAPLAIVIFLAMFAHIVMASNRVMSAGKKIIAGVMVGIVLLVGMGDRLRTQAESIVSIVQSDQQDANMEWRSKRAMGNEFARYAGKAVFAPLIFTIPFPTFNMANEGQILQMQLCGGNYIKNIFSFFVILVIVMILISGEWRQHVFILAYTLGYLMMLVLSNFAQSSRFHMPIWPFLMLFAAYGIQIAKTNPKMRRWFSIALVIEVFICLGWNWFKLKGRGMI